MNKYDHSQLKAGDLAFYGGHRGFGYGGFTFTKTIVDRLTTTQIIMADGTRFRRDTGRKIGPGDTSHLLDPKGEQLRDAMGTLEASAFGYSLTQWDKVRREVRSLESWEICLAQLDSLVAEAQRKIREIKKEME